MITISVKFVLKGPVDDMSSPPQISTKSYEAICCNFGLEEFTGLGMIYGQSNCPLKAEGETFMGIYALKRFLIGPVYVIVC